MKVASKINQIRETSDAYELAKPKKSTSNSIRAESAFHSSLMSVIDNKNQKVKKVKPIPITINEDPNESRQDGKNMISNLLE